MLARLLVSALFVSTTTCGNPLLEDALCEQTCCSCIDLDEGPRQTRVCDPDSDEMEDKCACALERCGDECAVVMESKRCE